MENAVMDRDALAILSRLCLEKKSGVMRADHADQTIKIFIGNGSVVFAASPDKQGRLGSFLRNRGFISEEQLTVSLRWSHERKHALGKTLIDEGMITLHELESAVRQQAEDTLLTLLGWAAATVAFHDLPQQHERMVLLDLHLRTLLLGACRRVDDLSLLKQRMGDPKTVFRMAGEILPVGDEISLNVSEWRVLALLNGKRSVQEVLSVSERSEFEVFKSLNVLQTCSLIDVARTESQPNAQKINVEIAEIVNIYHEILNIIRRKLIDALGQKTYGLIEKSKKFSHMEHQYLMSNYSIRNPLSTNINRICAYFDSSHQVATPLDLIQKAFNQYLKNLIEEVRSLLGDKFTEDIVFEINAVIPYFKKQYAQNFRKMNLIEGITVVLRGKDRQ